MRDKVRVLQRGLYRAAKARKERRFGVLYDMCGGGSAGGIMWSTTNADAECATFRETCMESMDSTDYGERCDGTELQAD